MQSKHTPGEWEIIRRGTGPLDSITIRRNYTSGSYVAEINPEPTDDPQEVKANARLIATAPELLEVVKLIDQHSIGGSYLRERAAEVIARAEGRS